MNVTLIKALVALAAASMMLFWSAVTFSRKQKIFPFLQLLGAGFLMAVVLAHICEGAHASIGHYLDLFSATLGLILFPLGYVFTRGE
jgi:hypothetical protein